MNFRSVRWIRTINLVAQAILVITLCFGLNFVAFNHSLRWDLTSRNKFSLSPETKGYLKELKQPVRVVVTLVENPDVPQVAAALPEIKGLLREFSYIAENNGDGRISVQYIDVYASNREAAELKVNEPNVIKFFCGDRSRVVTLNELYRTEQGQFTAFLGEQVFTTAILDVARTQKKVYFLSGHGEFRVDNAGADGLSVFADDLRRRNFSVETIDISASRGIPNDAALIVAVRPQRIEPSVQEQLRQYLTSATLNGRLLLFLAPGSDANTLGVRSLLEDWGVWLNNDVVIDPDPRAITDDNHLLVFALGEHPITQELRDIKTKAPHIGISRSLRPDPAGPKLSGLKVTTLAATSTSAWGEINYLSGGVPEFTPSVDLKGLRGLDPSERLGLAVASERIPPRDQPLFNIVNGRIVVFGSTDYATNQWYEFPGNQSIVLNAVSWATGRDLWLSIPPRPIERFRLSLSARDLTRLRYSLLLALPGAAALLGIFVYWTRRT